MKHLIKTIPHFPHKGIMFKDITPLLKNCMVFRKIIDEMKSECLSGIPTAILGIEARGFILGAALANEMGLGFIPLRKHGKLPRETWSAKYGLEYGSEIIEIHKDALGKNDKVIIVDDILATGGTSIAAACLAEKCGAEVLEIVFLLEIKKLKGYKKLKNYKIRSLIKV